jgi:hypothetical protein
MAQVHTLPAPPLKAQHNTQFGNAIQAIVREFERDPNVERSIPQLCRKYHVKRRRLYDVINVFTAIGCCSRNGGEQVTWHGRDRSLPQLKQSSRQMEIHNPDKSLTELFPPDNCVGLTSITQSLILLFAAMRVEVIDLREVSCWFSRNSGRYKTTLCKLYQIALILGAVGVLQRTQNVCEVKIQAPFTELLDEEPEMSALSIETLLNRPPTNGDAINRRKAEYLKCWSNHFRVR